MSMKPNKPISRSGPAYDRAELALNFDALPRQEDVDALLKVYGNLGVLQPQYDRIKARYEKKEEEKREKELANKRRREREAEKRKNMKQATQAVTTPSKYMTAAKLVERGTSAMPAAGTSASKPGNTQKERENADTIFDVATTTFIKYREADFNTFEAGLRLVGIAKTMVRLRHQEVYPLDLSSVDILLRLSERNYEKAIQRNEEPFERSSNPILLVPNSEGDLYRVETIAAAAIQSLQELQVEQRPIQDATRPGPYTFAGLKLLALTEEEQDIVLARRKNIPVDLFKADKEHAKKRQRIEDERFGASEAALRSEANSGQLTVKQIENVLETVEKELMCLPDWPEESVAWNEQYERVQEMRAAERRGDIPRIEWLESAPQPQQLKHHLQYQPNAQAYPPFLMTKTQTYQPSSMPKAQRSPDVAVPTLARVEISHPDEYGNADSEFGRKRQRRE